MTVCLDRPNSYEVFLDALESIKRHEPMLVSRLTAFSLIVSEVYDSKSKLAPQAMTRADEVRRRYPGLEFIQKAGSQQWGQGHSLNIIIARLVVAATTLLPQRLLWVHWEESWLLKTPFLPVVTTAFISNPDLTQLQLTHDWHDMPPERKVLRDGGAWFQVLPHNETIAMAQRNATFSQAIGRGYALSWPLYSLRPSANDAGAFLHHPQLALGFSERRDMWPLAFEYDFAKRWLLAGSVKGVLSTHVALRHAKHVSSYRQKPA